MLSYDDNLIVGKLSDFGLAQSINPLSTIANTAGRYQNFAPECFWNTYLPSSDVFSAGLVFYKMVTGVHPWHYNYESIDQDNSEQISTVIISARKEPPRKPSYYNADCSEHFDNIILKAISINLENRFINAIDFYDALISKPINSNSKVNTSNENISKQTTQSDKPKGKGKGFDAIAGVSELKDTLYHDVIMPLKDKELYERYKVSAPNGMLLYGPPGCGKTFISRQFAEEIGFNFNWLSA